MSTPFDRIVLLAGGTQAALVREINSRAAENEQVSPQAVSKWASAGIPPNRCRLLEEIAHGQVTRYEMCPEVFGEAPELRATEPEPTREAA